jgi:hypothetical protein
VAGGRRPAHMDLAFKQHKFYWKDKINETDLKAEVGAVDQEF